ncbi:MAG: crossover junction endodeoxyribonuclease RuvC [Verrucomicrobiota bacterium]
MGISAKQFQELQERVKRPRRGTAQEEPAASGSAPPVATRILGLDPSLRGTGWGVVAVRSGRPQVAACGTLACPARWERSRCLARILTGLREVLREHPVEVCAVEGLFYAQNLQTALIMGEARGAALAAVAEAGLSIFEIAPRKVKLAMVGYGAAQKLAVARMVQRLTGVADLPAPDAADALAVALTYLQETGRFSLVPLRRV